MLVIDILSDQKIAHHHRTFWSLRWKGYKFSGLRNWQICRLAISAKLNIPEQSGIYTLLIQLQIAYLPTCYCFIEPKKILQAYNIVSVPTKLAGLLKRDEADVEFRRYI